MINDLFIFSFEVLLESEDKNKDVDAKFTLKSIFQGGGKTRVEMNSVANKKRGEEGLVEGHLSFQPSQDIKLRIISDTGNNMRVTFL